MKNEKRCYYVGVCNANIDRNKNNRGIEKVYGMDWKEL